MAYGKISDKQREILEYIKKEILNRGYPPAVREICEAVDLKSTSSVHSHLETLEKNGYIRRDPTKPRAIEIIDENFNLTRREVVNVPMLGRVAAGQPILAVENIDNYFPIPAEFMPNEESFMLRVKGESMINIGILDGDNILVKRQKDARNGAYPCARHRDRRGDHQTVRRRRSAPRNPRKGRNAGRSRQVRHKPRRRSLKGNLQEAASGRTAARRKRADTGKQHILRSQALRPRGSRPLQVRQEARDRTPYRRSRARTSGYQPDHRRDHL